MKLQIGKKLKAVKDLKEAHLLYQTYVESKGFSSRSIFPGIVHAEDKKYYLTQNGKIFEFDGVIRSDGCVHSHTNSKQITLSLESII